MKQNGIESDLQIWTCIFVVIELHHAKYILNPIPACLTLEAFIARLVMLVILALETGNLVS